MHSRQRDGVLWRVLPHNNSRMLIHLAPSFAGATRLSRCLHTRKFWTPPPWPSSFQQFCPIQLVEYLDWWNTTFSFIQARRMTIVLLKIFLIRDICQIFFFIVFDPQEMSLNIDINMILLVKYSGVSTANICLRHWAATWWILARYSTQIPLAHHQFCRRFCIPTNFWTTRIFFPMQNLIEGSRSFYKGTVQNLIIRRPLCAEDWRLSYHQSKTNTSVNYFPNQLFSLHFQNDVLVFTRETWLKLVCSSFKANKGFPVLTYFSVCILRGIWLSKLHFPGPFHAEDDSVEGALWNQTHHWSWLRCDSSFTWFFLRLFDITSEQSVKLKWLMLN